LQVTVTFTAGEEVKRGGSHYSPSRCLDSTAALEPTRRQWRWRVEQRAATIPALFRIVLDYFVIFRLFNVIFVYF
jgi:hypothetical protein